MKEIKVRETTAKDLETIMEVELQAFENDPEINTLVRGLFEDTTAEPILSLMAYQRDEAVGHILFTKAIVENSNLNVYILAPMAVTPEYQNMGIGGNLIKQGIKILKERGVDLVFLLGHIEYYPKFGFINNAEKYGYPPTYSMPEEAADAWMYQILNPDKINMDKGRVKCAKMMDKEEYWIE